jgi:hypothetical protein
MIRKLVALVALAGASLVPLVGIGATAAHATQTEVSIFPQIPSDCSADVTDALNFYFALLPNDTIVDLPTNGCYLVNQAAVHIDGKTDVTIEGHGTKINRTVEPMNCNCNAAHVWLTNDSQFTIDDLWVNGTKPPWSAYPAGNNQSNARHGFLIEGANGLIIENSFVTNVLADGVKLQSNSNSVALINNWIANTGRQGITFQWINGAWVTGNVVADVAQHSMDIETNVPPQTQSNLYIASNTLSCWAVGFGGAINGTANPGPQTITNNNVINPPGPGTPHC